MSIIDDYADIAARMRGDTWWKPTRLEAEPNLPFGWIDWRPVARLLDGEPEDPATIEVLDELRALVEGSYGLQILRASNDRKPNL